MCIRSGPAPGAGRRGWRSLCDDGSPQALLLLEYLIKNGSEQVAREAKVHLLQIKTLKDFQYIDEERKDVGLSGAPSRRSRFAFARARALARSPSLFFLSVSFRVGFCFGSRSLARCGASSTGQPSISMKREPVPLKRD